MFSAVWAACAVAKLFARPATRAGTVPSAVTTSNCPVDPWQEQAMVLSLLEDGRQLGQLELVKRAEVAFQDSRQGRRLTPGALLGLEAGEDRVRNVLQAVTAVVVAVRVGGHRHRLFLGLLLAPGVLAPPVARIVHGAGRDAREGARVVLADLRDREAGRVDRERRHQLQLTADAPPVTRQRGRRELVQLVL